MFNRIAILRQPCTKLSNSQRLQNEADTTAKLLRKLILGFTERLKGSSHVATSN